MTIWVGIDVSKKKHDVVLLDDDGEVITKFKFRNTYDGFYRLNSKLCQVSSNTDIQIALEDTGHYAYNLLWFLRANSYQVFSYNPLLIKEFAKSNSLRKTKTDKKDALTIAQKLRTDTPVENFVAEDHIQELKFNTRHRDRLVKQRSYEKVQYTKILDIIFPELSDIVGKTGTHAQCIYELFKKYPTTEKISRARESSLVKIPYITAEKAHTIHEATKRSIGRVSDALAFELLQVIEAIEFRTNQIKKADDRIQQLMNQLDSPILSIPGIGFRLGGTILAKIRDIQNFQSISQLLAFAGLEPSIHQSGQLDNAGHMVKRCSPHLRWLLIQAVRLASCFSPTIYAYLDKKLAEGKHFNVAITHAAKNSCVLFSLF